MFKYLLLPVSRMCRFWQIEFKNITFSCSSFYFVTIVFVALNEFDANITTWFHGPSHESHHWLTMLLFIYLLSIMKIIFVMTEKLKDTILPNNWNKVWKLCKRFAITVTTLQKRWKLPAWNKHWHTECTSWHGHRRNADKLATRRKSKRDPDCCRCHVWLRCTSEPSSWLIFHCRHSGMLSSVPVFQPFPRDSLPPFCRYHSNTPARHQQPLLKTF